MEMTGVGLKKWVEVCYTQEREEESGQNVRACVNSQSCETKWNVVGWGGAVGDQTKITGIRQS